jgi:4-hydroxy-tetrahydrodipicolinate synthase
VLFPGIIPAALTPFTDDDRVDTDALTANVRYLIDSGVHGIIATGTMGEAGSLSDDERRLVVDTCIAAADGRVPVTVGVSSGATAVTQRHAAAAREAGAHAVMCLPPLLYRGDERELIAWYSAVADAGLPIMAYNNPEASGIDLAPSLIARIASEVPAVQAVKECSGDARRLAALIGTTDIEVLVGGDDWALEGFAAGSTGWVSGVANVAPVACCDLFDHVSAGRLDEARAIYQRLLPLARLDMTPKLVQYFKGGMDAVGLRGGPVRPPRMELTADERAILDEAVAALKEPVAA